MTLWVDGSLVAEDAAVIRANDHGLVVGDGVFETCKVVDGEVFALSRHLRRLRTSATGLGLQFDEAAVRAGVAAVTAGQVGLSRLRITLTGGPAPYGSGRGDASPSLLVASVPWHGWDATAAVAVVPWTRNEHSATAGIKTTSYAENVVALARAVELGASEAIFANTRGELCEGTGSNVFVGIGGRIVTPPLDSGCLPGITRELIVEWLGDVDERALPVSALAEADEAFLASSTRDVQPIRTVDGGPLPSAPGPLTTRAIEVFATRSKEIDP
ncbi:MAG TPA: aminotransferase class IV [Mycobacteriales bacterium]|jgi:branched-chain amino acid aminotransferase|nr:aminotransferase class IV [Mycobacteriales bacterium]